MSERKVRRAPIISNDKITGVVSMDDLIAMLAKEMNTLADIPRAQSN